MNWGLLVMAFSSRLKCGPCLIPACDKGRTSSGRMTPPVGTKPKAEDEAAAAQWASWQAQSYYM